MPTRSGPTELFAATATTGLPPGASLGHAVPPTSWRLPTQQQDPCELRPRHARNGCLPPPRHLGCPANCASPTPSSVPHLVARPPPTSPLVGLQYLPVTSCLPCRCPAPHYTPSPPLQPTACWLFKVCHRWPPSPGNSTHPAPCPPSPSYLRHATHSGPLSHATHPYGASAWARKPPATLAPTPPAPPQYLPLQLLPSPCSVPVTQLHRGPSARLVQICSQPPLSSHQSDPGHKEQRKTPEQSSQTPRP